MFFRTRWIFVAGVAAVAAVAAPGRFAQGQAVSVSGTLRPALAQVGQAVAGAQPEHWKVPRPVKSAMEGDIEAIQRDLNGTLAGLLTQADAQAGQVPAEFEVYRNVDALYDTLLRVAETADLAAPEAEASALQGALSTLETARGQLGDTISAGVETEQSDVTAMREAIRAAQAAVRRPVRTTVVTDYGRERAERRAPHPSVKHRVKRKTTAKAKPSAEKKPAAQSPQ